MNSKACSMAFVDPETYETKHCTREGFHGPFHATDTETMTRLPGGAWVKPRKESR